MNFTVFDDLINQVNKIRFLENYYGEVKKV